MKCVLVSHTHWDREWYRTFQHFRARLVDTVDRVLDLIACDPGYCFLLDGQTIVLEDYLEIRPGRRDELEAACRSGRLAIGPWYVQPDSLLPSGEAHVRNLLEGRRVGQAFGPVSRVAYTPDSFGHPSQLPQLFAGFGLGPFVYWRGNGNEIADLPAEYRWQAPDGSTVLAHHLSEAYFNACGLPTQTEAAAAWLEQLANSLVKKTRNDCVLLMNGIDHALPDAHTGAVAQQLAQRTGWSVQRGLLEDFAAQLDAEAPLFCGELIGGRVANLLPGVWSTRTYLKIRNRRSESLLEQWAEPWAALLARLDGPDERPALRLAWRALLPNQAHDSICGCSQDRVHEQMIPRYDAAEELATQTTLRALERIAGLGSERRTPWSQELSVAVFNPSPHPRTDVVRLDFDPSVWFETRGETEREMGVHPLLVASTFAEGFTVGGEPARLVTEEEAPRLWLLPQAPPRSIEFVAREVPPFGWLRLPLRVQPVPAETEDDGREIECDGLAVAAAADGTLSVRFGDVAFSGLCAVEDCGDGGDTYDFDPVPGAVALSSVAVHRWRAANGMQRLLLSRQFQVPRAVSDDLQRRLEDYVSLRIDIEACVAPGVPRVDLKVRIDNPACDHRLRLVFPTGAPAESFFAATTFDVARRSTAAVDDSQWIHPAPTTFVHQGFVHANGLTVVAPGLNEAEVSAQGVVSITLLRAVGWLARMGLKTREQIAGPMVPTPGAQCIGRFDCRLSLLAGLDVSAVRDAEAGLMAVVAGDAPLVAPGQSLLSIEPREVILSALAPASTKPGTIVRLLNPTDQPQQARIHCGFAVTEVHSLRLDEAEDGQEFYRDGADITVPIGAHSLRTLLLLLPQSGEPHDRNDEGTFSGRR